MRKKFDPKFWSHGTPLGYLGPGSQKGRDRIFSKPHFLFIWGPYDLPTPLDSWPFEKSLDLLRNRCDTANGYHRAPFAPDDQQPLWSKPLKTKSGVGVFFKTGWHASSYKMVFTF